MSFLISGNPSEILISVNILKLEKLMKEEGLKFKVILLDVAHILHVTLNIMYDLHNVINLSVDVSHVFKLLLGK